MMTPLISSLSQGVLQGLTEYLPVSSSAHLAIFQHVTGNGEAGLAFDLVLHVATVCSTLVYFRKDILRMLFEFFRGFRMPVGQKSDGWYFGWAVIFGSMPTAIIGLLLKPFVERIGVSMAGVGGALLVTSALMSILAVVPPGTRKICRSYGKTFSKIRVPPGTRKICVSIGLIVGIAQGIAVIPGISRSGATLVAGILCGLSAAEAFRFSFLLSLPAITGAAVLELRHSAGAGVSLPEGWLGGALFAFVFGLIALYWLHRTLLRGRWWIFALYCGALGLVALIWL